MIKHGLISLLIIIISITGCDNKKNNTASTEGHGSIIENGLKVHFINVAKADCILIQTPNNKNILIDSGDRDYTDAIVKYLNDLDIKTIDTLLLTHPDQDHSGGMARIIHDFEINNFYMYKTAAEYTFDPEGEDGTFYTEMFAALTAKKIVPNYVKIDTANPGNTTSVDFSNEVTVKLLGPIKDYDDTNDDSIVLKMTYKNVSYMFTGDAMEESENDMLSANTSDVFKADILKAGHHGKDDASTPAFFNAVGPKYVVISSDSDHLDKYKWLLDKCKKMQIDGLCTAINGNIIISTDGDKISQYREIIE